MLRSKGGLEIPTQQNKIGNKTPAGKGDEKHKINMYSQYSGMNHQIPHLLSAYLPRNLPRTPVSGSKKARNTSFYKSPK